MLAPGLAEWRSVLASAGVAIMGLYSESLWVEFICGVKGEL